MVNRNPKLTAR